MDLACTMPAGSYYVISAVRAKKYQSEEFDADKATGLPLWRVRVMVVPDDADAMPDELTVKVATAEDLAHARMARFGGFRDFRAVLWGANNSQVSLRASGLLPVARK